MINEIELREIARKNSAHPFILERDLVFINLLLSIGSLPSLAKKFVLKGGGALRRVYFADWRNHENLRFSIEEDDSLDTLNYLVDKLLLKAEKASGIKFQTQESHQERSNIRFSICYTGPLKRSTLITIVFSLGQQLCLSPLKREVITHPFSLKSRRILAMPLEEILAEKLKDFLLFSEPKDLYDSWRLIREHQALLDKIDTWKALEKKCQLAGFDLEGPRDFLDEEIHTHAGVYWITKLQDLTPDLPPFEVVQEEFCELILSFFG